MIHSTSGSGYNRNDTLVFTNINSSDLHSPQWQCPHYDRCFVGDSVSQLQFWGMAPNPGFDHVQFADGTILGSFDNDSTSRSPGR